MQLDFFNNAASYLAQLKSNWRATIEGRGGYCPCCDRWGKISPHSITEKQALTLAWMRRAPADEHGWINMPLHAPHWVMRSKNFSLLQHWGLVQSAPSADEKKKGSGHWRLTQQGKDFIAGRIQLPLKAYIYNNQVEGWSDQKVSFQDCFGRSFDYAEVMSDDFVFRS